MLRRDYFVACEYGDIWNVEPLPTFLQAWHFKNYLISQINTPRDFFIRSTARKEIVKVAPLKKVESYGLFSDF